LKFLVVEDIKTLNRTMSSTLSQKKMGIQVSGLPVTRKCDKLRRYINSENMLKKLCGSHTPESFHLHIRHWFDGDETEGTGVFVFPDGSPLGDISQRMNFVKLDKKHDVFTCVTPVCGKCSFPIKNEHFPKDRSIKVEKASTLDSNVCEKCLPPPVLCCCCGKLAIEGPNEFARDFKYFACDTCQRDRSKQEEWRNTVGVDVKDTESSYVEGIYLSDEAIEIEKKIMGGEPRKPLEDDTPFMYSYIIEELINPKSYHYWPYGMSAHEYLEYRQKKWFDNPMEETTSDEWMEIDVTKEIIEDYWKRMTDLQEKYGFKSLKDPGDLPTMLEKDGHKYTLFPDIHGATCDNVICRAINNLQRDLDGGGYAALVLTGLPLYTTRKGDLSKGNARDAGYGHEYCLACIMKD
jgi:hypothetical protein